ncbi:MAG: hypothetical protein AAB269_03560 [Bacteroidota bacterium]
MRFLLYAFLFYILFIIVSGVLRAFFGFTRRPSHQPPASNQPQPSKPLQEYKDVAEAKFKDVDVGNQVRNERGDSKPVDSSHRDLPL